MTKPYPLTDFMLDFVREAGRFALDRQATITQTLKYDQSIVTETDLAISHMFADRLAARPDAAEHFLIDEELIGDVADARGKASQARYLWILDPIDGTAPYASGMPLWGVMISLFIDGKPVIGAAYTPALNELLYTDGVQAFLQVGDSEPRVLPPTAAKPLQRHSIVLAPWESDCFVTNRYAVRDFYSSIITVMYTALGRSAGGFFNDTKIWDAAVAMPLAKVLGLGFYDAATGDEIKRFDLAIVDAAWQLQPDCLLCHPQHLKAMRDLLQ